MKRCLALAALLLVAQPAWASWSHVRTHAHNETKTSGTTISGLIVTADVAVGDIFVVLCGSDNPDGTDGVTTHHSVSDSVGNSYTRVVEYQRSSGSANDGVTASIHITKVTTAIPVSSNNPTCTVDSSVGYKAVMPVEYSLAAGKTWSVTGTNGATGNGTGPTVTLSGLASASYGWFGTVGWEGPIGDFSAGDADYSNRNGAACSSGGAAASNGCIRDNDRLNFTGTSDTLAHTLSNARDWVAVLAAISEVDEGAPPPVQPPLRRQIITRHSAPTAAVGR